MHRPFLVPVLLAGLTASLASPAVAQDKPPEPPTQDRPIRNAPSPRAIQFAAYIYSASNVCGYRIGTEAFKTLLAQQNVTPDDVSPRGPFANRLAGQFTLMSNQMALNREQACIAIAGEYGPEGSVAKNVLLPAQVDEGTEPNRPAPVKPAR